MAQRPSALRVMTRISIVICSLALSMRRTGIGAFRQRRPTRAPCLPFVPEWHGQTCRSDRQCGPGGGRTHDQSIMSRPMPSAVLTCENAGQR
jgi:hypothetical protein